MALPCRPGLAAAPRLSRPAATLRSTLAQQRAEPVQILPLLPEPGLESMKWLWHGGRSFWLKSESSQVCMNGAAGLGNIRARGSGMHLSGNLVALPHGDVAPEPALLSDQFPGPRRKPRKGSLEPGATQNRAVLLAGLGREPLSLSQCPKMAYDLQTHPAVLCGAAQSLRDPT